MPSTDQRSTSGATELLLAETAKLCNEVAAFRREMTMDHAEIDATCCRIDHHLNDLSTTVSQKTELCANLSISEATCFDRQVDPKRLRLAGAA
jgi:hypothetical protein